MTLPHPGARRRTVAGWARRGRPRTGLKIILCAGLIQAFSTHAAQAGDQGQAGRVADIVRTCDTPAHAPCKAGARANDPDPFLTQALPDPDGGNGWEETGSSSGASLSLACAEGRIPACEELAGDLSRSMAPEDRSRALQIYSVICTSGSAVGCHETAWRLYDEGGSRALARARFLFTEACLAGHAEACLQAGDMRRTGEGGSTDPAGAGLAYRRACEAGVSQGCLMMAPATEAHPGTPSPEAGSP